jgi:uncharacterized protein YfaS (alpha-2-macroglobulin family)
MDTGAAASGAAQNTAMRETFAETAFWAPSIAVNKGAANFNFKAADRFTQWNILAAIFTKDVKTGKNNVIFTTRKDLMVRLETPRFLRENDKINLQSIINNDTDKPLTVALELTAKLDGRDIAKPLSVNVKLPAKAQQSVSWALKAPMGAGKLTFTAVARAGELYDGEVKEIPLLPSARRLAESVTVALEKEVTTLELGSLLKDSSAKLEAVHLQVDPSLLMPVINAIPLITFATYESASGLVNSYLPLAILNSMYNTYPGIKAAVSKLPKRATLTPAWDVNEDMLLKELALTPWYNLSKGYESKFETINIFNPGLVKRKQEETLKKLSNYQNDDGGFTWIKGGKSDIYITLLVLDNMASARNFGVDIPQDMVKKALVYVTRNISIDTKDPSYYNVSNALYMAYVLTSYPKEWYKYDIKSLMALAEDYSNYMTPLGKTYAALIYHRLGDLNKAQRYIELLFDTAKENPTTGIYWAPEEHAWLWYNDSLSFHTMVIKALLEINPDDARINGLVKWLMFSKKATMWGNTEAASKAVYTLLNVIKTKSDFTYAKTFKTEWAGEENVIEVEPFDLSSKVTYSKYAPEAGKTALKAIVTRLVSGATQADALPDFASLSALFYSSTPKQPAKGLMNVTKEFYLVQDKAVKALKNGDVVKVGDEIQVRLTINTDNRFDYVAIEDPKPAAFEADALLSGWKYDKLMRYEEVRDSKTNFFMNALPHGTYELKYTLRPTTPGTYNVGAASMQSTFAPEFATHSSGFVINV